MRVSPRFLFFVWQCVVVWFALSFVSVQAQVIPQLSARVTDLTNTLTPAQRTALERALADFEQRKGAQVAVLIVPTTKPETVAQYAVRAFEVAKIGRVRVDDGVLLLVAKDDREMHIEVGYGLEGVIPDAIAKRTVEEVIVPFFKRGDYYGGIEAGVSRLMRLIDGEPLPPPQARDSSWNTVDDLLPLLFIAVLAVGGLLRALFGRLLGALIAGAGAGFVAWSMAGLLFAILAALIVFILVLVSGSGNRFSRHGGYGGWGSGGWSSGGGSGGWSGGGGSSGGGGASGRW